MAEFKEKASALKFDLVVKTLVHSRVAVTSIMHTCFLHILLIK